MWKSLGLIAVGVLVGAAFVMFVLPSTGPGAPATAERSLVAPERVLSDTEVDVARSDSFESIRTIQDVLSLPSQFDRDEAMYVLAGRSNAGELQALIFEGDRISDRYTRNSVLGILFRRLAEVDPQSALALARVEPYNNSKTLENTIWRAWARNDLDSALFEVKTQSQRSMQVAAAQVLYAAHGYMGNETTDRIEAELGIEPDRNTRLRFLRTLLEKSPDDVIDFIGKETSALRRREYINWLVYAIEEPNLNDAVAWSESFTSNGDMALYRQILNDRIARLNPLQALQAAVDSGDIQFGGRFQNAMQELASSDMEAAMSFYDGLDNQQAKFMSAYIIVSEMAVGDPQGALEWAESNGGQIKSQLNVIALGRLADTDPELALEKAAAMPLGERDTAMSSVFLSVARRDSDEAMALMGSLPESANKRSLRATLGRDWLMQDSDGAIEWLKTLPRDEASRIVGRSAGLLSQVQPGLATDLLPFLDADKRGDVLRNAVTRHAASGKLALARSLITEYSGQQGVDSAALEVSLIEGLSKSDPASAEQLAMQLQSPELKDKALVTIVGSLSQNNPMGAARVVSNIRNQGQRESALMQLSVNWVRSDPSAALQWVRSLSKERDRVKAIESVMGWRTAHHRETLDLINTVADPAARVSLKAGYAVRVARSDKEAALRMLQGLDLSKRQRAEYLNRIESTRR